MTKAFLISAALFATWMAWPELSQRFMERVNDLPSFPTLQAKKAVEITDPDIIYHGAKQWDPFTAPTGYENTHIKTKVKSRKSSTQGDGGCNRILPNSGKCDSLQYYSGSIHTPSGGIVTKDLL
jgi:hypothetical protein